MDKTKKVRAGFTLMEAVIALAIWMLLFSSVFAIWHNASRHKEILLARQSDFESARGAMDILLANMQMAKLIDLRTGPNDVLIRLSLPGYNPDGIARTYQFTFDINLRPTATTFQRLSAGGQEVASNIASVRIWPEGRYMRVILKTSCDHQFIFEGSVDIRYRQVFLNGVLQ